MSRIAKIASIILPSEKPPILFDDFNRADSQTLGTAITGQAWTAPYGKCGIVSNKMLVNCKNDGISNILKITHSSDPAAITVSVDITVTNSIAGTVRVWFGGRTVSGYSYGLRFNIGFNATHLTGVSARRINSQYLTQEVAYTSPVTMPIKKPANNSYKVVYKNGNIMVNDVTMITGTNLYWSEYTVAFDSDSYNFTTYIDNVKVTPL
jgi:hypothetical protein